MSQNISAPFSATILVVDDNDANRYAVVRLLRTAGFQPIEASTGGDALHMLACRPDLVVLDVRLPDIDGFEVCRRIKATSDIPVLLHLSADFTSATSRVQGLNEGADAYLTHPFEQDELIAIVNSLLRARRGERRRIEERELEIENRYHLLAQSVKGYGIMTLDREGRVASWNGGAQQISGYSAHEILGRHHSVFYTLDEIDQGKPEAALRAARVEGGAKEEGWRVRRDGSAFWAEVVITARWNLAGAVIGFTMVTRDLTERRAAEEARRAGEERLRALAENTMELVCILNADGTFRYVSAGYSHILGYDPESLLGTLPYPLLHADDVEPCAAALARTVAQPGEVVTTILRVRHADGSYRTLEISAQNLLEHPAVSGIVCNGRDVTDRQAAEDELRFQAHLLDAVEQAVIATTLDGTITYWNRFAERLYGWSADEVRGRNVIDVTPSDVSREQGMEIMERLARGDSWSGEFLVQARDGRRFPALVTNSPILDPMGALAGVVGVSFDATERRELEEQLQQSRKLEAIGKLAGGIAHDFNNILTVISTSAEFVRQVLPPGAEAQADVAEIQRAAMRASALTSQLLAFSRKQVLTPRELDLNVVVSEMERMFQRLIGDDISLHTRLQPELGSVLADQSQIEQVLLNLVVNARDAMPRGGRVAISTSDVYLDETSIVRSSEVRPGPYVMITVCDTGHGMDRETMSCAFEPFFTTKPVGEGTGLGLATVYGIVKQSGGHVWVYSEPGEGATFKVYLPRCGDPLATVTTAPARRSQRGTECVLLIEDEEPVRRAARRILEKLGYTVIEAANGRAALHVFEEQGARIDVVVTDTVMPEMGGRDVVDVLRGQRPHLPVLYMSGYTSDDVIRRGVDPGADFIEKPFTAACFAAAIRGALDGRM
jgi:PAS domain S-box-containing protein